MNPLATETKSTGQFKVTTFNLFPVNQTQTFEISFLVDRVSKDDLIVNITNVLLGSLDKQLEWHKTDTPHSSHDAQPQHYNRCCVSFQAPIVGIYSIEIELLNQTLTSAIQHQAKAYDLSKVFINNSSGRCGVNESYEFGVDASEAGEGQLEIAVNEGEIPNQVQVLENGKCIVNFAPEEAVPHVVDIKFNGYNVNGCPFVVEVSTHGFTARQQQILGEPCLIKNERTLVDSSTNFTFENIKLNEKFDKNDLAIIDPENRPIEYSLDENAITGRCSFEFKPAIVGDYAVELRHNSTLAKCLPASIIEQFPLSLKVFDFNKVIVSDVTDGVVGHPVYFFIDASQAGSGNLEIRVLSATRYVPNHPQSEANSKIRVNFTPTEAVEHSIDVKFNGISVPNNPFKVRVSQFPQARLPVTSQDLLKYVAVDEFVSFYIDYLGQRPNELSEKSCKFVVLKPDFTSVKLSTVELVRSQDKNDKLQARFKVGFKPTKIGPYKLFIAVNNEIMPGSPIISNVYNSNQVKVHFNQLSPITMKPFGKLKEPVTFTVDASQAGEGTLALAVVSGASRSPVQTDFKVSEKGDGLYNLTFVPTEFALHSIDMSFNDRVVPDSPFVVDIMDFNGRSAQSQLNAKTSNGHHSATKRDGSQNNLHKSVDTDVSREFSALSVKSDQYTPKGSAAKSKISSSIGTKEDDLLNSIVVHGVSLKRTPVSSTGAFIIETNGIAQAQDFDVLIADPNKSIVDVQCYLQQDGNLLAEWTPERVGSHKIEVLFKNRPVPGSPFITEAFDPSAVKIIGLSLQQTYTVHEPIVFQIDRRLAGQADLEVILTNPNNSDQTLDVTKSDDDTSIDVVTIKQSMVGDHKLSVTFGGYDVPKSPMKITIRDKSEPVKLSGNGLKCAEINRTAQFNVESSTDGELKIRIECDDREVVPKVERKGRIYIIKYKPTKVGLATISLYWNGVHIDGSPYTVPVNDLSKFTFLSQSENDQAVSNQITIGYEARIPREVTIDTSRCGPGDLKAEAYCRANQNIKFSIPVNRVSTSRHKIIFACPPSQEQLASGISLKDFPIEATYLIRFYYNNLVVPEALASVLLAPPQSSQQKHPPVARSNNHSDRNNSEKNNNLSKSIVRSNSSEETATNVTLRGNGSTEAKCGEEAVFIIDGRDANDEKPEVNLIYDNEESIKVKIELIEPNVYRATYKPLSTGNITLNVFWGNKLVSGCPILVSVDSPSDAGKVTCTADSLKGGILGDEIKTFIDTRKAGPGELTALCTGPQKVAFCELLDRGDGTFILYIKPQEAGRHFLTINYGGQHIPKSPFSFKVSDKPDSTKVRVYGPGVEHGVLSLYQSRFVCDTRGAGAGQLTVRIRGPKGAFRMETQRENQRDRAILCKYDPTEPGDYRIEIKWSGRHVPGSPFSVMIFDTQEELNRFLLSQQKQHQSSLKVSNSVINHPGTYQPTLVEYSHYSNSVAQQPKPQPHFRLQ